MVLNVINFIPALIRYTKSGFLKVPDYIQEDRYSICRQCPKFNNDTCIECGCLLKVKTTWATEECPLGRWKKVSNDISFPAQMPNYTPSSGDCNCNK